MELTAIIDNSGLKGKFFLQVVDTRSCFLL